MVRCTLPVFAEVFTFRRDQYLTAATHRALIAVFKDILLVSSPSLGLEVQIPGAACSFLCVLSANQELLAGRHEHVCMRESLCIGDAGRCHPSLSPSLLQCVVIAQAKLLPACREQGSKEGSRTGANTSFFPFLKVQIVVLEGPTLLRSVAGLLILQGLNHLLSPAKEGETGKGLASLYLTAES